MQRYDVVIIGSGLGGLECAAMLSKEGKSVCVLEKNAVFGGCLQSFRRSGQLLDTGIHYLGGMDEGQIMRQYFTYFGVLDQVRFRRLDNDAFDVIRYRDKEYNFAQGYERFADTMSHYFPEERQSIQRYTHTIAQIFNLIGVEHLRNGVINQNGLEYFGVSASKMIESTTPNKDLQNILAGTVTLYGGVRDSSSLYHHAMICGSNIAGAYRIVDGSQTLADALVRVIRQNGGVVQRNCEVTRIVAENSRATAVEVNKMDRIEADCFISDMHPVPTFDLVDKTHAIKKAFLTRINALPNSYGLFSVYLVMKKDSFPYLNSNYYLHRDDNVWATPSNLQDSAIQFALLSTQASSRDERYADVVTILCPMYFREVEAWNDTTVEHRGEDYEAFKRIKAEQILDFVSRQQPNIRSCIAQIYTTTPLTYRDYTATVAGSAYGILKSCHNPFVTLISTRTKIENLFLTGQNLNVHGALGVTLTATLTCAELLGGKYLAQKIGNVC